MTKFLRDDAPPANDERADGEPSAPDGTADHRPGDAVFFIDGQKVVAPPLDPGLYVVATPIGNLADITLRALSTLAAADVIACEDTRVSRVLLQRYGISRRLIAYHEHNAQEMLEPLISRLSAGERVALISDAGTPLISDPGFRLVRAAAEAEVSIVPIPGPSAAIAALSVSGLPTDSFFFAGFLSAKSGERRARLADLAHLPGTLVFYETPHRIAETLADMVDIFGADRPAVLARELTKLYEEHRRLPLGALQNSVIETPPRGEIVLLVGAAPQEAATEADIDAMLLAALAVKPVSRAASDVAKITGLSKKEVYARALKLEGKP